MNVFDSNPWIATIKIIFFSIKYVCGFQQNGKPKRIELWNMSNETNEVD